MQRRFAEAEPAYDELLETKTSLFGAEHFETVRTQINRAALYAAQGRTSLAEQEYLSALEIYDRNFGPTHPGRKVTLRRLAKLYESTGRDEEAARMTDLLEAVTDS